MFQPLFSERFRTPWDFERTAITAVSRIQFVLDRIIVRIHPLHCHTDQWAIFRIDKLKRSLATRRKENIQRSLCLFCEQQTPKLKLCPLATFFFASSRFFRRSHNSRKKRQNTKALANKRLHPNPLTTQDGWPLAYLAYYKGIEPDPDGTGPLLSPVTFLGYNASAELTYVLAPDGGVTRMDYSPTLHRQTSVVDPVGRSQNFFYNSTGNMVTSFDGGGFATSYVYNSRGLATSVTDPDPDGVGPLLAPVTSLAYDSFSRLTTVTNPDSSTQTFTYNSADQMLTAVDELAKTTAFDYDALGRTTSSTNRVNALTQWGYDDMSRVTTQTDPMNNLIDVFYNNRGWVSKIKYPDPDGSALLNRAEDIRLYDFVGNPTHQNDPRGNFQGVIEYQYDVDNRVSSVGSSANTGKEFIEYDNMGRKIGVIRATQNMSIPDFLEKTVFIEYDIFSRLKSRITRDNITNVDLYKEFFAYNKAGELISRTDGLENVSQFTYDGRGLPLSESLPDPDGDVGHQFPLVVTHKYDNMGREIVTDRGLGRVTSFEYNNRSWLTKVTQPDPDGAGAATAPIGHFAYNVRGDQTAMTDPLMRVTNYVYDNEQRLVTRTDPDPDGTGPLLAPVTSWGYNANDWMTSSTDPVGAVSSLQYDWLGRLQTQTDPDPDGSGPLVSPVTSYAYNMTGLLSVTNAMSGTSVYGLDNRGRVKSMTDPAGLKTEYVYDYYDNLLTQTDPDIDGTGPLVRVTSFTYDEQDRMRSKTDPLGTTLFGFDTASNLNKFTDPAQNITGELCWGQTRFAVYSQFVAR